MRLVIQRVSRASVTVKGEVTGAIGAGILVLIGVSHEDTAEDVVKLADKTAKLRIFDDAEGRMNLSLTDVGGEALAVSQFTLFGDCAKGNRPSYNKAARPEHATPLYEAYVARLAALTGKPVATGVFGADMKVASVNDGPVTLILDSRTP